MSNITVVIQGSKGSYHEMAACQYFGLSNMLYGEVFEDVFVAVQDGRADYGVIAVENSLYGSIGRVLDLLRQYSSAVTIVGEEYVRIHHCLIGLPDATLKDITEVHSQAEALGQCLEFLKHHVPQARVCPEPDTAGSVALVRKRHDKTIAAIASKQAAVEYGLRVLHEKIEDDPQNYTRFLVVQRKSEAQVAGADKTSLVLDHLGNELNEARVGLLRRALGAFADAGISLSKIESRPVKGKAWRYRFYIDCAAGMDDPRLRQALQALQAVGATWKILGTFIQGETVDALDA
ncbi:MAG TPA: prephenate dehydratase [Nevskiaceae bacterium]|nr:prephenate dehydratase [Nevskiaceae bacterium]